jgi:hypothetical protein
MASISWKPNANGYWTVASNWSGGIVPAAADAVTLTSLAPHTVYFNTNDTVASVTSTNDLLAVQGGTLGVSGMLKLAGGLSETGGVLNLLGTSDSIAGPATITYGDIGIGPTTTLTLSGSTTFGATNSSYGARIHGAGTLVTTGTTTIADNGGALEAVFGGGLTWDNTGTVAQAGLASAYYTPASTANLAGQPTWTTVGIVNLAGASYDLTSDDAAIVNGTAYDQYGGPHTTTSTFLNAGTLAKTGGTGTSHIYSLLTNTGTLAAQSGTLELDGGGTIGGTITGQGTVALAIGSFTLTPTVVIQAAFLIDGATVTLGGNLAPTGAFSLSGGTLELNGHTLALASAALLGGTIDGLGTLTTSGTTATGAFSLGGGANWVNTGTVNESGNTWDYAADVNGNGTITNQAGASWNFVDDSGLLYYSSNAVDGSFVNAGTFAKTGGTSTSYVRSTFTSTGVVSAAAGGTLEFDNSGTIAGTISGAGTFAVGSYGGPGTITLASGTTLAVANILLDGGTITLGGAFAYGGAFSIVTGELELNGNSFSVNSASLGGTVDGAGTFTTGGTTTAAYFYLGGGADWVNTGTVVVSSGYIYDGDGNGPGTITNTAGASFDLTTDTSTQPYSSTAAGSFVNAGTIAKTGGTGTSNLYFNVTNSGVLTAASGTLELDGGGTIGGTISGAGTVAFGNWAGFGSFTIVSGTTISVANLLIDGGTVTLDEQLAYAGAFVFAGGTLDLNGNSVSLQAPLFGDGEIDGSGTITTSGTTTVNNLYIGGGADWVNTGVVNQSSGDIYLGDILGSGTITNAAGASINFTMDYGTQPYNSSNAGSIVNAGVLAKTGGTNTSLIYAAIASTGTITAATGTLEFDGGGSIAGAITGAGQVAFGSYYQGAFTIAAGTTISVANLLIDGATVTLGGSFNYAGAFAMTGGVLELNGQVLTVKTPSLSGGEIDGPGWLVTSGTTSLGAFTFGGAATWINTGTIVQGASTLYVADGNGTAEIVNEVGAVYDLAAQAQIASSGAYVGAIANAGVFEITSAGSDDGIAAVFNNTGTIDVVAGEIDFEDGGTFGGTIIGSGTVSFGYDTSFDWGNLSIASSVTLILADYYYFDIASITLTGAVKVATAFNAAGESIELGGYTLSVSGASIFGNATAYYYYHSSNIDGTGTLATSGATTIADYGSSAQLTLSGGAVWSNSAKVTDSGVIQLGSNDGAGTITNASTGVFDLATDDAGIIGGITYDIYANQDPVYGTFSNAGILAKTAGTATSTIDAVIINTGTLSANSTGILAFADGGTLGGKIAAGIIQLNGGDFILNGLTDASNLQVYSETDQTGTVTLGAGTATAKLLVYGTYNIDNDSAIGVGATGSTVTIEAGGTLAKIGGTATSTIAAAIADNGTILADAAKLDLTLGVTGSGSASVANGASLEFGSSVANTVTVTLGSSSTLIIDALASYKAPVAGFIQGDTIDVKGIVATTGTASSVGLLTLKNGTTTVGTLQLVGNHTGDVYNFTSDGNGGTLIGVTKSTSNWTGGTNDWATTSGWSAGLPGAGTDATIGGTSTETVTISPNEYDAVHSLTLSDGRATLAINGGLTATTTIAATAGIIALSGGLTAGTIIAGGGSFTIPTQQNAVLTAAAFQGALDLSAYDANLTLTGGPSFSGVGGTGKATLTITGQYAGLYEQGNVTLDNAAIALGNANAASTLFAYDTTDSGSLLTLGANAAITQAGIYATLGDSGYDTDGVFLAGAITAGVNDGLFTVTGNLFENDGKITVSNGDTLAIQSTTFTNAGSLSVTGATLDLASSGSLGGTITVSNSTLDLGSTVTTAQLLSILTGSDTVNLSGTINNAGATLNLTQTKPIAAFSLAGGEIEGGTLILPGGTLSATGGELLNVTVDGGLVLNTGSLLLQGTTIDNAAGSAPGAVTIGAGASLEMEGYASITNAVTLSGGTLYVTGEALGAALPVIAAGTKLQGSGTVTDQPTGDGASEIVNQGTIAANVNGATLTVAPTDFVNQALMTATNGGTLAIDAGTWANTGTISVTGSTLDLGGTFSTSALAGISDNGGTVNLTGTLNNAGSTLSVGTGSTLGVLTLDTGSFINGGTIADGGGGIGFTGDYTVENTGPTLSNVTYEGALNVTQPDETVFVAHGLTLEGASGTGPGTLNLTGQNARLEITNSTTLNNATINIGSNGGASPWGSTIDIFDDSYQGYTLTLGSGLSVIDSGANADANFGNYFGYNGDSLVNNGTVAATGAGSTFYFDGMTVTNLGLFQVTNGGTFDFSGNVAGPTPTFTNLNGTVLTGGTYSIGAASKLELANNSKIVTDAADIILTGTGSAIQAFNGTAQVTIDQTLTTIASSGTLALAGGRNWSSTLAVTDAGKLQLAGSTFKTGTLAIAAGGTLGGYGTVTTAIANNGVIEAGAGGTLTLSGSISGTGQIRIDAGGKLDAASSVVATQTVTFGGAGGTLKIDAPATFKGTIAGFGAGDAIDVSTLAGATISVSGTTLTVTSGTTTYTETINALPAGTVLVTASDGKAGTELIAYAQAVASGHSPEPVAFGNHHVGDTLTQTLGISNTAAASGYAETLDGSIGSATPGVTATGSFTHLAAGATSTALAVGLASTTPGAESGTATITLNSDGAGLDGRGTTALPSQTVTISGAIYAYAADSLSTTSIAFGNAHVGDSVAQAVTLTNTAAPSGGYAEALDASIAGTSGSATANGAVSLLGAGASSTALSLGLSTATAGAATGQVTLALASDGTGTSGLGLTALPAQTIAVTGAVYAEAAPVLASTSILLGNAHVGAADSAALSITNGTTNAAYTEGLDASFTGTTGSATDTGTLSLLAAGASDGASLGVGLSTATAGALAGTATLGLTSDGAGTSGLGTTALPAQTIAVSGDVYAYAAPVLAATSYNAGVVHVGQTVTQALTIANAPSNPAFTEALDAGFLASTGSVTGSGTLSLLGADAIDSQSLLLALNTATAGTIAGTATLGLTSDGSGTSGLGTTALPSQTITLGATVDNYAVASLKEVSGSGTLTASGSSYTLNLGSVLQGAAALSANLEVLNSATGLADLLGGSFTVTTGSTAITNTGLTAFSGLGAGAADTAPVVKLATTTAGTFSEKITIASAGSNASGYSGALAPITLTVTGIVAQTYTLTAGADTISAGTGNDLILATGGALSAGDSINGGGGTNTLKLSGGGTFDLSQPTTLTNLQLVTAQEASGAAAQTVILRNGYVGTITAVSGAAGSGITIVGAADSAVINLGSGTDTVTVGAATETIKGGSGTDTFNVTAATIRARIAGGAGTNTLAVSGGGTVAMGTSITGVTHVALNDTGVTGTSFTANTTSGLAIAGGGGTDTITLGAAKQSVAAGAGTTLVKGVMADAGDLVTTAGTTTFELTSGGTGTLNAGDGGITVKLDAASNLGLGTAAFITVEGAATGKDTLTAGAANQTLESLGGTDTLVGSAAFGDTFLGTAAGFTGDAIRNFGGSDVIDFTDIMQSTFKSLAYSGSATSGKLVVTDGTHSGAVTLAGSYTKASFVVGTDAHGGTLISFT